MKIIRRRTKAAARSPERVQLYTLIRAAQIRFLYRQLPRSFIGNMIGALVLSIVLIGARPIR
jgi:hypothetical protein